MIRRIGGLAVAIVLLGGMCWLGSMATHRGEPAGWMPAERALVNHSTLIAWWLTWFCYPQLLIPICVALIVLAWRVPAWRSRVALSIVVLLLSWRGADFFQRVFGRPRRLDWVVKHERSFSYPSSHAAIVAGFYWLWAWMLAWSELPGWLRYTSSAALVALGVAICWSRLALGAHYATDLIGGSALGLAFASAGLSFASGASGVRRVAEKN